MIVVAPRSLILTEKLGKRGAIATGLGIQAVGFVVLSTAGVDTSYVLIAISMVLLASGMAILMPAGSEAIVSSLPPSKAGVGSAVNDTTREVGGALGIAVLGTLLASGYRSSIKDSTAGLPTEVAELAEDSIGGALRVSSDPENGINLIGPAREAFVDGMTLALSVAAAIGVAAAAVILWRYPRKGHEPPPMHDGAINA